MLRKTPLSGAWFVSLVVLLGLGILSPSPALAETSYHKLKKRLRKVERVSGQVLQVLGAITVAVVCEGTAAIVSSALNDDCPSEGFHPGKAPPSESPKQATKVKGGVYHAPPGK